MTPCPAIAIVAGMESQTKRVTLRCKLISPFLGDQRSASNVRRLDSTTQDGVTYFLPSNAQWRWALKEAMDACGILSESDVDYVRLPTRILMPKTHLYVRVIDRQNPDKRNTFECFQAGTVVSFPILVLGQLENQPAINLVKERPPTVEEIRKCFQIIGEDIGLSPWGSKFGYGRFILLDDEIQPQQQKPTN